MGVRPYWHGWRSTLAGLGLLLGVGLVHVLFPAHRFASVWSRLLSQTAALTVLVLLCIGCGRAYFRWASRRVAQAHPHAWTARCRDTGNINRYLVLVIDDQAVRVVDLRNRDHAVWLFHELASARTGLTPAGFPHRTALLLRGTDGEDRTFLIYAPKAWSRPSSEMAEEAVRVIDQRRQVAAPDTSDNR